MDPGEWRHKARHLVCGFDSTRTLCCGPCGPSECGKASHESVSSIFPDPLELCLTKSPLVTAMVPGILSCLTTPFWGSVRAPITYPHCIRLRPLKFSDRYGRVQFLGINVIALLLSDSALAALAVAPEYVPGGYWFVVYVSVFEGLIGGRFRLVNSTTPSDDLSSPRTFRGHCGYPCISCRLQRSDYKVRVYTPAH